MTIIIIALIAVYVSTIWLPRLLVAAVALLLALEISRRVARKTHLLLQDPWRDLDYDRKSTHAERRLMRASLRLAIQQTELRSLFPSVAARADAMASQW
jgi:hypothetical protein